MPDIHLINSMCDEALARYDRVSSLVAPDMITESARENLLYVALLLEAIKREVAQ